MTLLAAIVADDLTGALDTSSPFVSAGLKVAVAMTPEAVPQALRSLPDVLAVNTASRALEPREAARRVADAAAGFIAESPVIVMKKVDSRLKGNVAAETAALAQATGRVHAIVAPAVPDQSRATQGGAVVGIGLDRPLDIAPIFAVAEMPICVRDATRDADLDAIVAEGDWSCDLAVGARGLGKALARRLTHGRPGKGERFTIEAATLFAFGSRDPITDRQIARLAEDHGSLSLVDAPDGRFDPRDDGGLPLCIHCTGEGGEAPEAVARRFGGNVAGAVRQLKPQTLVMGGGDTAFAILSALGVDDLFPRGEAAPGLPWFEISLPNSQKLRCVVKSGGFGTTDVLSELLRQRVSERAEP